MKPLLFVFLLAAHATLFAQSPKSIPLKLNSQSQVSGDIANGANMSDLSWAWNSSNACFPKTQFSRYNGKHILFQTELPKFSAVQITLIPKNGANLNLYGYSTSTTSPSIVPNLPSCVSCEANSPSGSGKTIELRATTNPYKIIIGVAGAGGAQKGEFDLIVKHGGGEVKLAPREPVNVTRLTTPEIGTAGSISGDLSKGVVIQDLSWAWNSSNACFPATQKQSFEGKHVLYELQTPKYSIVTVTLIPINGAKDLSLYGYQVGTSSNYVVPNLPRCVTCEADNNQSGRATSNQRSISFTSINNPYKLFVGVAGAKGISQGDYELKIETKAR